MEVEHIIKTKHYFELTAEELAEVSNYAVNETEFDDMKSFLLSTQHTVQNQKIISTPDLDDKVLNYLNESYAQTVPWYNSVLLFLFPRDKQFFRYPAFQIGIASLLVFGVFNMVNFSSYDTKEMAFEDVAKHQLDEIIEMETTDKVVSDQLEPITNDVENFELVLVEQNGLAESKALMEIDNELDRVELEREEYFDMAVVEEVVSLDVFEIAPAMYSEKAEAVVDEEAKLELDEDDSFSEIQTERLKVTTANKDVKSSLGDVSKRKDKKTSYNMKGKTDANVESNLESTQSVSIRVPIPKPISIQSTPELFQLFFEVK